VCVDILVPIIAFKKYVLLVSLGCCFKNLLISFVLKICVYISGIFSANFAALSAISFPLMFQCPGVHKIFNLR